jgi:hypothetical protein
MVQMLFNNIEMSISLNRNITKPFKIERGVRQSYPLAPYLFILAGKVLNFMVKEIVKLGDVRAILLEDTYRQETTNNILIS